MTNWWVETECWSEDLRKKMIGEMVKIGNLVAMSSTCYSFGGHLYKQSGGAGIGLRISDCSAKVTMSQWDKYWARIQQTWLFTSMLFIRYIDDVRIYCYPVKQGWTWTNTGWEFNNDTADERNPETRTKEELCKSFNVVLNFLEFTAETGQDFDDRMLPTLDVKKRS